MGLGVTMSVSSTFTGFNKVCSLYAIKQAIIL